MVLGLTDLAAAFVLLITSQILTVNAGFSDLGEKWSLIRRSVYTLAWVSLFSLAIYRFDNTDVPPDLYEAIPHFGLLIYIMLFPLLRVFNVTSQDALKRMQGKQGS